MNLFDCIESYDTKIALTSQNETITYKELISCARSLPIKKNELVLLFCNNDIESIVIYVASLIRKSPIYLIDANTSKNFYEKTVINYEPEIIVIAKSKEFKNKNYFKFEFFKEYVFYKKKKFKKNIINKNLSILLTTSGTTGTQKLAKISHKNILKNTISIKKYLKINKDHTTITTLPMFYSYGLSVINSHLYSGGKIILSNLSLFDKIFWADLEKFRVNNIATVPFFFDIFKKLKVEKFNFKYLKYITVAGGALDKTNELYFNKLFKKKGVDLIKMYGSTEASPRMSYLNPRYNFSKLGSIGKAIPGGKLHLKDDNDKKIEKTDTIGQIIYKGPNIFMGYANSRKDLETDETPKELNTGDLGYYDKQNFFYLVGRKKRFAKIYGHRVNLDEVEKMIKKYGFENAVVSNDKKIQVFLKKNDQLKIADILNRELKINKSFLEFIFVKNLPINKSGKINYEKLKRL